MRSDSIVRISAAGSRSRTITDVAPSYIPATAQPPPPMWNSGMATRFTESRPIPHMSLAIGRSANRLWLLSITPFGRPVVPDEYSWNATSPASACTPGSSAGYRAIHSS